MFGPCIVIQYFESFYYCNHLGEEDGAGCIILRVFQVACGLCSLALPHVALG